MIKCSVGIMAYNEEKNIGKLLKALLDQKLKQVEISEIFVVASGCTDQTAEIVRNFSKIHPKIILLIEEKRNGKASAINLWLKNAREDILVMESADTLPEESTVEKLAKPFEDMAVGMTGAHPTPDNDPKKFMGFAAHLMWNLHHEISLQNPKMGEMVAFRKIISEIPLQTAVDEAEIEARIKRNNLKVVYVPDAIVRNHGPENIRDFLKQRRRIQAGHLALKKKGYSVSTASGKKIFFLLIKNIEWSLRSAIFTPLVVLLEVWGRILGRYDFWFCRKKHHVWEIAKSTKKLSNNQMRIKSKF